MTGGLEAALSSSSSTVEEKRKVHSDEENKKEYKVVTGGFPLTLGVAGRGEASF